MKLKENLLQILYDFKAFDINCFNTSKKNSLFDWTIIATGNSFNHINIISSNIVKFVKKNNFSHLFIEGKMNTGWILIDCCGILIHLMLFDIRNYYKIEDLLIC